MHGWAEQQIDVSLVLESINKRFLNKKTSVCRAFGATDWEVQRPLLFFGGWVRPGSVRAG